MARDIRKLKEEAAQAALKGRWKKAAELYDELAKAQPDDAGALHRGGEALRKLGKPAEAVVRFEKEAAVYARQGFLIKAIAICKLILEIDPAHTATQATLSSLYALQHREEGRAAPPPIKKDKRERTLPPGQPLEAIELSQLIPTARPVAPHVVEIPTEGPDFADEAVVAGPPALPKTPLFSALGERELRWLIENVQLVRKHERDTVFSQGDRGDSLYVIASGEVQVMHQIGRGEPIEVARLGDGAFFGEIALLTNHPRSATVVASRATELIEITREVISDLIEVSPGTLAVLLRFLRDRMSDTLLETSPMFSSFSAVDRRQLIARFRFLEIDKDTAIIREGERADGLYVLLAGRCVVLGGGQTIAQLGPGELAGEMSLLSRQPASATVKTASKCYLLQLPREVFAEIIVTHPQLLEYAAGIADVRQQAMRLL